MPSTSNRFEKAAEATFKAMKLDYYAVGGQQILLRQFYPTVDDDRTEEFDGILLIDRTCVLVEVTEQARNHSDKIKQFIRKGRLLMDSPIPVRDRFAAFNRIPRNKLGRFQDVNDWRFLYIGTSSHLRKHDVRPDKFPDAEGRLTILWSEEWQYLRLLAKSVGPFAPNELFASLDIDPPLEPGRSSGAIHCEFVELPRCRLGKSMPKADVYVTTLSPHELLKMCHVPRFQHLPIIVDPGGDEAGGGYQRLLNADKLRSIREQLKASSDLTFPNSIIVVGLGVTKVESGTRLSIPFKYASLALIDGQHRLFAFAGSDISDARRRNARLLTTIIQFSEQDLEKTQQHSAALFIGVNKNQAKVKTELIYLTAYDAMGDSSPTAVAGKVLINANDDHSHPLAGLLRVRPALQSRQGPVSPIPIVTIAGELAAFFHPRTLESVAPSKRRKFFSTIGCTASQWSRRSTKVSVGAKLLKSYFVLLRRHFSADFGTSESNLLCAKYLAAFVRLLRILVVEEGRGLRAIDRQVAALAANARAASGGTQAFPGSGEPSGIPSKKASVNDICDYLNSHRA